MKTTKTTNAAEVISAETTNKAAGIGPVVGIIAFVALMVWGIIEFEFEPVRSYFSLIKNFFWVLGSVFLPSFVIALVVGCVTSLFAHLLYKEL